MDVKPIDLRTVIRFLDKPAILAVVAAVMTAVLMNFEFNSLEANLYDLRMTWGGHGATSDSIALVTLDEKTTAALGDFAPLSLDQHVKFIEALEFYSPKAIGYLINMNHVNQVHPELFDGELGLRFVDAARRFEARSIPFIVGTPFDVNGEVLPPYPLSSLEHSIALIHKDGNVFSSDKVTRRALVALSGRPAFHLALARATRSVSEDFLPRGTYSIPDIDASYFFFRYHDNKQATDAFKYPRLSYIDIIQHAVPPELIAGKTLLIGTYVRDNPTDSSLVPSVGQGASSPKLVIHANILDSILKNDGIARSPSWLNALTIFLFILFVVSWVVQARPLSGMLASGALASSFLSIGHFLFGSSTGLWIHESQPLMGILFGYYFVVPYRLLREYQKRWDYQRQNELLKQVEELKTNFLSLVTHDLKTPVARIQGLAEVIQRSASSRLLSEDLNNLQSIIGSTEELNRFITSILELTKVESNHLQIKLESKDVNALIESSVEGFQTHAHRKNIEVVTKLDPLFPVKIDPSLISKVINNLIDNAIKYSPENSQIVVQSREVGDWVEISVKDQGVGLSEEDKMSLFRKFFRVRNEATSRISGTGLGLYLTRYFVEAHLGQVEVQSEKNKGSTFIIRLPLNLDVKGLRTGQKETNYVQSTRC